MKKHQHAIRLPGSARLILDCSGDASAEIALALNRFMKHEADRITADLMMTPARWCVDRRAYQSPTIEEWRRA